MSTSHPLLLVWGAGVRPTCYASVTPVLTCVWGGMAVTTPTFITPSAAQRALGGHGNWTKLLSCPVPLLNVSDGTVVSVAISVTMPLNNPVLTKIEQPAGTHGTFTVSIGPYGEISKSVIMARYYSPASTHDFSTLCGCNALVASRGRNCDKYSVCGGSGGKVLQYSSCFNFSLFSMLFFAIVCCLSFLYSSSFQIFCYLFLTSVTCLICLYPLSTFFSIPCILYILCILNILYTLYASGILNTPCIPYILCILYTSCYIAATSGVTDCNGDAYGNAFIDTCGVCAGGYTHVVPFATCNPSQGEDEGK